MTGALYHGTTRENLTAVTPAAEHGGHVSFQHDTDVAYAYATPNLADAWIYAEKAWHASSSGIPRVYRVEAVGDVEPDPQERADGSHRGNYEADVRSRAGFTVVEEMPWPDYFIGSPGDWR
jgi:hypothetical protein